LNFTLPEKEFYSFEEVAELWGVDHDLLSHYISEMKILRVSKKISDSSRRDFVCVKIDESTRDSIEDRLGKYRLVNEGSGPHPFHFEDIEVRTYESYDEIKESFREAFCLDNLLDSGVTYEIPKYVYPLYSHELSYNYISYIFTFENLSGDLFLIIERGAANDKTGLIGSICVSSSEPFVIPTEEKNRFEEEYSKGKKNDEVEQSGNDGVEKNISTKSKNAYLKTIQALSDALIDGLTGSNNKDANAILASLDIKGIDRPVGDKTLAKYLEEARKL